MFQVGDTITYGTQGVCRIVGTEENDLGGDTVEYYVLKPVFDENATVYVPKNNRILLSKMRPVLSEQEARALLHTVQDIKTVWTDDDAKRRQEFQELLSCGDRTELCALIKTLSAHQKQQKSKGKHLHINDEAVLKQAKTLLFSEIAFALQTTPDQVEKMFGNRNIV